MPRASRVIPDSIRDKVSYDPETGLLTWKVGRRSGDVINFIDGSGGVRVHIRVNGVLNSYYGHRVAWFLTTGDQPDVIDHLNGDRKDNRLGNLRNCSQKENLRNMRKHREGVPPGIYWLESRKRWHVRVSALDSKSGSTIHVGYYVSLRQAVLALQIKLKKLST